jgi:hypothetical protein
VSHFGHRPEGYKRYGHLLRPIGAHLDTLDARYITIAEVADGFLWHCFKNGDPASAMSGSFAYDEIPALIDSIRAMKAARQAELMQAIPSKKTFANPFRRQAPLQPPPIAHEPTDHPICPLGYEETLRSLGNKLEDQRAHTIVIVEREATMLVRYSLPLPTYIKLDVSKQEMYTGLHENDYSPGDLRTIVEDSRQRRGIKYYQS